MTSTQVSGLLRASVGARAVPLHMQVAVLRVEKAEFSLYSTLYENSVHTAFRTPLDLRPPL
jgi:hypothetical protein